MDAAASTDHQRSFFNWDSQIDRENLGYASAARLHDFLSAWLDATNCNAFHKLKTASIANFDELKHQFRSPVEPFLSPTDLSGEVELRRTIERFSWNFQLNAVVVIHRKVEEHFLIQNRYEKLLEDILSNPFVLQSLFRIREAGEEGMMLSGLKLWKGTEKYIPCELPDWIEESLCKLKPAIEKARSDKEKWEEKRKKNRFGFDLMSMHSVFEDKTVVRLSSLGRAICRLLHPNCADPDLPHRLTYWAKLGADASELHMARYIRIYFGRLRRYLDKEKGSVSLDAIMEKLVSGEEAIDKKRFQEFCNAKRREKRSLSNTAVSSQRKNDLQAVC